MKSLKTHKIFTFWLAVFSVLSTAAEEVDRSFQEQSMLGVLFVQTSPEFAANNIQTYKIATSKIDIALNDKNWTAALEQGTNFSDKPPAIIVDVDETVLDNSAHQARAILGGFSYPTGWLEWGNEVSAPAVAGVKDFLNYADSKGVTIFYVTNRVSELRKATIENIIKLGLPFDERANPLMMKGENGWGSEKTSRRTLIAEKYRIILMAGDQITDFISLEESSVSMDARLQLSSKYEEMWGEKWFMITNPMYGKWEGAIYNNIFPNTKEREKLRLKALNPNK
ncbi:MAG: 5'-nucleotidase, lipoprotein e(P4) family [Gammaproteobacteria bacterium]